VAAGQVRAKLQAAAAALLEAAPHDVEIEDGSAFVRGAPGSAVSLAKVIQSAIPTFARPGPVAPDFEATVYHHQPTVTYTSAVHVALVEVDVGTGAVRLLRYVVAHDCGRLINPLLVEGQIHGGVAHGIGNAFYEQLVYDDNGQLLNASFMDYLLPTALDVPRIETDHHETPSPFNPSGLKGVGEAGCIPTGAAFAQAVENALAEYGLEIREIPLSPGRLYELIQEARARGPVSAAPVAGRKSKRVILEGEFTFEGQPDAVWDLLLDPAVLGKVLPGVKQLEKQDAEHYLGVMAVHLGPISAAEFTAAITLRDQQRPERYSMEVDSRGNLGFARGSATVQLTPRDGGTRMKYRAELHIGGKIAAVGQRLIETTARLMSRQGLAALNTELRARLGASR